MIAPAYIQVESRVAIAQVTAILDFDKEQTAANEAKAKAKAKRAREADETEQRNQSSRRL